jgi:hypothetical protein
MFWGAYADEQPHKYAYCSFTGSSRFPNNVPAIFKNGDRGFRLDALTRFLLGRRAVATLTKLPRQLPHGYELFLTMQALMRSMLTCFVFLLHFSHPNFLTVLRSDQRP